MIELRKSTRKDKKYMAIVEGKKVHFGAKGYSDYTIHKDPKRKEAYLSRHKPRENWNDKKTAGFWSRWILWNKPTLRDSIRHTENKFGLNIVNKI